MATKIKYDRRSFLSDAFMTFGAAELTKMGLDAAFSDPKPINTLPGKPGINKSFDIKQINAGELNVGYIDEGPVNGTVVVLLHGWPYDIYSFADVVPLLTSKGYRVIVPYLRGYGTTTFLSKETPRNGQQSVVAFDIISLMDAI